jgi:tetratricopeptide (TPR) repeat protein
MTRNRTNPGHLIPTTLIWLGALGAAAAQDPATLEELEIPPEAAEASTSDYVQSLRNARDGLMSAGDFDAALSPAQLVIAELEGGGDQDLAADHIMLATILAELGRFDDAELLFLDTIAEMGEAEGGFSPALIRPMHLLGRTYIRSRRFSQAVTVLGEARHISQRNEGLFNVEQSTLIDDMTTAYLGTGDTAAARDLQVERLTNAERRFGAGDPRTVPFHNSLADYYSRSRMHGSAREQYTANLEIARSQADPLAAMEPLRRIASIDMLTGDRHEAIEELAELVAAHPEADAYERGLSLAVLGDRAIVDDEPRDARALYEDAWAAIAASGRADPAELFADPAIIRFIPPLTPVDRGRRSLAYSWGQVELEFTVDDEGRVSEITSVGASPEGLMERAYVERLQQAFFRPQLQDGRPVTAENVRLTHYFRYYVEEEDADE